MDLKRIYLDSKDQKCNILELVKREPEWAANRVQAGERYFDRLERTRGIMQNDILSALDDCVELGMPAEGVREVVKVIVSKALANEF